MTSTVLNLRYTYKILLHHSYFNPVPARSNTGTTVLLYRGPSKVRVILND